MNTKFELTDEQQARCDAWFKHHFEVVHAGQRPRDMTGYAVNFVFSPTGMGTNVKVVCVWCSNDHPNRECDLTEAFEVDGFIYEYDENWNIIPTSWEKKT